MFLLDENLSPRLAAGLSADFPGSVHVEARLLRGASDAAVWDLARTEGYAILSKDNDFRQRSFLDGPPPKVVWLSVGNAGTSEILRLLTSQRDGLVRFLGDPSTGLLVLPLRAA